MDPAGVHGGGRRILEGENLKDQALDMVRDAHHRLPSDGGGRRILEGENLKDQALDMVRDAHHRLPSDGGGPWSKHMR